MSLDLNNVSTKFQLDRPANNRIVAGSLFSHFSGSLFSDFSKRWEIQQWMAWQPSFYIEKMSLYLNNVSTKFQFNWAANNRIIEGSLFSHFSGSLFSHFSGSLFSHFSGSLFSHFSGSLFSHISGSLFSDFSICWEIQQWMPWQPSFYISKMILDLNNVSTKFQLDWPANNRIIAGSLFSYFSGSLFSDFSKCWEIQQLDAMATKFLYFGDES